VDAHLLLGELYYLRQELDKAKESWERALRLAPSRQDVRQRLERLQREAPVEQGLARSDTYPFVVRFAEDQVPVDLGQLRQMLRDTYRLVGQQFDYFPDHPITVILYPEEKFEQVKGLSHQVAGLYDGKIRLPLKRQRVGHGVSASEELQRVLWHEYTHALVHDLSRGECPLWLNEGLAGCQEARIQPMNLDPVRESFRAGRLLTWDQLWQREYEETNLHLLYTQSYLVASYLVNRWGWRRMVKCLERIGQGTPLADAMQVEYKSDPAVIEKEWHLWLKRHL
jgi:hypothetical protein